MGWQGEGRRFTRAMFNRAGANAGVLRDPVAGRGSLLGVALVAMALVACAESAAGAASSSSSTSMAAPANGSATTPGATADRLGASPAATERIVQRLTPAEGRVEPENAARSATARGSEPGVSDTTITPRHLEAELNRLEAELAN